MLCHVDDGPDGKWTHLNRVFTNLHSSRLHRMMAAPSTDTRPIVGDQANMARLQADYEDTFVTHGVCKGCGGLAACVLGICRQQQGQADFLDHFCYYALQTNSSLLTLALRSGPAGGVWPRARLRQDLRHAQVSSGVEARLQGEWSTRNSLQQGTW
jgi:hypothetical protein